MHWFMEAHIEHLSRLAFMEGASYAFNIKEREKWRARKKERDSLRQLSLKQLAAEFELQYDVYAAKNEARILDLASRIIKNLQEE